jgi:peptide/nickel transport system permease protein
VTADDLRLTDPLSVAETEAGVDRIAPPATPSSRFSNVRSLGPVALAAGIVSAAIVLLALIGPWLSPHTIAEPIGPSYQSPISAAPLGTDSLGRDILSRVLAGGRGLILVSVAATCVATILGAAAGLVAGFSRGFAGWALMRMADILLILPAILVLLVLGTSFGGGALVLMVVVVVTEAPRLVRITRAATLEIVGRGYVEAAIARGERAPYVLFREVLPNISGPLLAYVGLLFAHAIYLTAAASFLGIGKPPPAADWGKMIQENFQGLEFNPWGVFVPAALLVLLAVGVNLVADAYQKRFASGRSIRLTGQT